MNSKQKSSQTATDAIAWCNKYNANWKKMQLFEIYAIGEWKSGWGLHYFSTSWKKYCSQLKDACKVHSASASRTCWGAARTPKKTGQTHREITVDSVPVGLRILKYLLWPECVAMMKQCVLINILPENVLPLCLLPRNLHSPVCHVIWLSHIMQIC